ncbi:MAG: XRE family transcriptional regulator, partial [Mogibacterium diversum]|uniref:LexA family protein n=1 Tax=Mogibacterium diversum TaxID=114527 RepID=UPI001CAFE2F1
ILLGQYGLQPIDIHKIPLLGSVACGEPIFASEDRELYVEVGTNIKADYCLTAKGDSMINARINDGDIVFIQRTDSINNGEIGVVLIDNDVTLKRIYYYPNDNKLILQAENSKYEPMVYLNNELDKIRIIGKAIAFQSDIM